MPMITSDDSDGEQNLEAPASGTRLARRAVFTREALGWQRIWNKYALLFKCLTALRVRMPRCFDKIGSWRLAKLLSQQTLEDLRPILSQDSTSSTWAWDSQLIVSENRFRELAPTERRVLGRNSPPEAPRKFLEPDFKEWPHWADRYFGDEDWGTTKAGEEKAIARAQDAGCCQLTSNPNFSSADCMDTTSKIWLEISGARSYVRSQNDSKTQQGPLKKSYALWQRHFMTRFTTDLTTISSAE
ncbi:hypothetical protein K458DRAFT_430118 [Lentithecium fluviatile CBS 122367]|uniref:Uncharacterized protein n=1 Tax=Lentithecium fluviatile CBS 122367 TaxID=1168545 RepID=A0A6G1J7R7_9PLEO|nr:hypothetical protein K458DRAFT_430118 [Lentithecium fluviatile CBS 122367]